MNKLTSKPGTGTPYSPKRIWTADQKINSLLLYQLSYREYPKVQAQKQAKPDLNR